MNNLRLGSDGAMAFVINDRSDIWILSRFPTKNETRRLFADLRASLKSDATKGVSCGDISWTFQ